MRNLNKLAYSILSIAKPQRKKHYNRRKSIDYKNYNYVTWDAYNLLLRKFDNLLNHLDLVERNGMIMKPKEAEKLDGQY